MAVSEHEIERLVVRLVGDGTDYQGVLDDAIKSSEDAAAKISANNAETAAQNKLLAEAAQITASVVTPAEAYANELARLDTHLKANRISQEVYDQAVSDLAQSSYYAADAQREMARAEQEAARAAAIAQEQHNRAVAETAAVIQSIITPAQHYEAELQRLNTMLGQDRLSQEQYNEAVSNLVQSSHYATQAVEQMRQEEARVAETQRLLNQMIDRGRQIMLASRDAVDVYVDEMEELAQHLVAGTISQQAYNNSVAQAQARLAAATPAAANWGNILQTVGTQVSIAGAAMTAFFGGTATGAVMAAGKYEQTTIAFETMLGSARQANALLEDLTEFAAKTPFEMPEVEEAARGLVLFGDRGSELMDTLNFIGNAAAGTSTQFGEVALIFNQVRGVGKLLTQDFRQLAMRGIISMQDLAKHFDVTTEKAQEMMTAGQISFNDLRNILKNLSAEGGRFANLMERQSKSFLGLVSTFKDDIGLVARGIGEQLIPMAKTVVTYLIQIADWFRDISPAAKGVAAVLIVVGASLGVVITALGATMLAAGGLAASYTALIGVTGAASASQLALAGSLMVARAAMVGIVVAGVLYMIDAIYDASSAVQDLRRELMVSEGLNDFLKLKEMREAQKVLEEMARIRIGGDRKIFVEGELEKANQKLEGLKIQAGFTQKELDDLGTAWLGPWSTDNPKIEAATQSLKEQNERIGVQRDLVNKLSEELGRLRENEGVTSEAAEDAKKFIEKMQEETRAVGVSTEQHKLNEIARQGVAEATLQEMQAALKAYQVADEAEKARKDAAKAAEKAEKDRKKEAEDFVEDQAKFIKSLQDEVKGLEMKRDKIKSTSEELKLLDMIQKGATAETIASARALIEQKNALEKAAEAAKKHEKMMEEGKRLTEQHLTPIEKYKKEFADFYKLYTNGAIDERTLERALLGAEEDFKKAAASGKGLNDEVKALFATFADNQAVRRGSKEFREMLANVAKDNALTKALDEARTPVKPAPEAVQPTAPNLVADAPRMDAETANYWENIFAEDARMEESHNRGKAVAGESGPMSNEKIIKLLTAISGFTQETAEKEPLALQEAGL